MMKTRLSSTGPVYSKIQSRRFQRLMVALSVLSMALMTDNCAMQGPTIEIPTAVPVTVSPRAARLPTAVGVYYSSEFKNDVRVTHETIVMRTGMGPIQDQFDKLMPGREYAYRIPVGPSSVPMIDGILKGMFETVVPMEAPVAAPDQAITAVIVPSIGEVHYGLQVPHVGTAASIQYNFTFMSPSGAVLAEWSILGTSTRIQSSSPQQALSGMQAAMTDAALQFVPRFYAQPGVQLWLARLGLQVPSTPAGK